MGPKLKKLRLGDQIYVEVVERIVESSNQICEYIVTYNGDLIRVRNESAYRFSSGEKILVRVAQVSPLQFQILTGTRGSRGFDVSI